MPLNLLLSDRGSCSDEVSKLQMLVSVTAEDTDPYVKAPNINSRDFRRERRTSSPNETQPMATVSN